MKPPFAERKAKEMKDVLMTPRAEGPKGHDYMIRGGKGKKNITVWESGTVGGEYIKSYGHYHVNDLSEVQVPRWRRICFVTAPPRAIGSERVSLSEAHKRGNGLLEAEPLDDEIVEFRAVKVKEGEKDYPCRLWTSRQNTGKSWLVTSDDSPVDFGEKKAISMPGHADYAPLRNFTARRIIASKKTVSQNSSKIRITKQSRR